MIRDIFLACTELAEVLALVDDFRTAKWDEIIPDPELVYNKTVQFLTLYGQNELMTVKKDIIKSSSIAVQNTFPYLSTILTHF